MEKLIRIIACAITAFAVLGLFGCGSSNNASSASSSGDSAAASVAASSSAAESAVSANAESSASAAAASVAAAKESAAEERDAEKSTASEKAQGFDFADECIDEHGNITLYALTELKGWQVATLLDQQGYEWDEEHLTWMRPEDGAAFFAMKETGAYDIDTYNAMNEKGGAIVAAGYNIVAGFKDAQATLQGNAECVIEDSWFYEDGETGIAIIYGPSMKEYLVIIDQYSESTYELDIYSQEAVASGMLDEIYGRQIGGSFQEVWQHVTGQDSYGH